MSFSLIQALSLAKLTKEEAEALELQAQTEEAAAEAITSDGHLLDLVLSHLPQNLSGVDRNLLSKIIVKAEEHTETFQPDLLAKIANVRDQAFFFEIKEGLSLSFHAIRSDFDKHPNIMKLQQKIRDSVAETYLDNPTLTFMSYLATVKQLLDDTFPAKLCEKIAPSPELLINEILQRMLKQAFKEHHPYHLPAKVEAEHSKHDSMLSIVSLLHSLPEELQGAAEAFLDTLFLTCIQKLGAEIPPAFPCEPAAYLKFRNEVGKTVAVFRNLGQEGKLSVTCLEALGDLAKCASSNFLELFLQSKKAASLSSDLQQKHRQCLDLMQMTIHSIRDMTSSEGEDSEWFKELDDNLFNAIVCKFTEDEWKLLAESECFGNHTVNVIKAIVFTGALLDEQQTTLKSFTMCLDKVYVQLLPAQYNLRTKIPEELLFNACVAAMRGILSKAVGKYQNTVHENKALIDFNQEENVKLVRRLKRHIETFKEWFGGEIELQVKMKISRDSLIAILFQLISARFKSTTQGYIFTIQQWIEKNPGYHFNEFEAWLKDKIANKLKIPIKKDPEFIYNLFLKEAETKQILAISSIGPHSFKY